jgi:hypothetical protein
MGMTGGEQLGHGEDAGAAVHRSTTDEYQAELDVEAQEISGTNQTSGMTS